MGQEEEAKAMRVLIPYRDVLGRDVTSPITSGGIERFVRHLIHELDDASAVDVTKLYYGDSEAMKELVATTVRERSIDLVICNYPHRCLNTSLSKSIPNIPIIWVNHHTAGLHPQAEDIAARMERHVREDGRLWMVSEKQADDWIEFGHRFGHEVRYHGIIPPSMIRSDFRHSGEVRWDVVTVGRCDEVKNPFLAHEVSRRARLRSLVMCGFAAGEYCLKNQDWTGWQVTGWNYTDNRVSSELSRSGVFLVTWPDETFGIAALEALAHGLPLVLYAPSGSHVCEALLPGSPWIIKATSIEELEPAIRRMSEIVPKERMMLSTAARSLHGAKKWREKLKEMIG